MNVWSYRLNCVVGLSGALLVRAKYIARADLKVSPNFNGRICYKDFGSKNILGSHMKVVHTDWIIGEKRTQDQCRLAEKERNGSV